MYPHLSPFAGVYNFHWINLPDLNSPILVQGETHPTSAIRIKNDRRPIFFHNLSPSYKYGRLGGLFGWLVGWFVGR